MTSYIFHRKNVSLTEDLLVRWIHLNHRKEYLSIGVRLLVLDIHDTISHHQGNMNKMATFSLEIEKIE